MPQQAMLDEAPAPGQVRQQIDDIKQGWKDSVGKAVRACVQGWMP